VYAYPGFPIGESQGAVTDLTLKRNASVAWISCFGYSTRSCSNAPYQVWRADRRAGKWEHELLEESSDIQPRSLRRQDSTITWRRGEATRSASLR
jgi:hypothetical protein